MNMHKNLLSNFALFKLHFPVIFCDLDFENAFSFKSLMSTSLKVVHISSSVRMASLKVFVPVITEVVVESNLMTLIKSFSKRAKK